MDFEFEMGNQRLKRKADLKILKIGFPVPMSVKCELDGREMVLQGSLDYANKEIFLSNLPAGFDDEEIKRKILETLMAPPTETFEAPPEAYAEAAQAEMERDAMTKEQAGGE
jgi:hypothetical protein